MSVRSTYPFLSWPYILIALLSASCATNRIANVDVGDLVNEASRAKSVSEQAAARTKSAVAKDSPEYRKAEALYATAKADFDGWLDQLKFDLANGAPNATSAKYQQSLARAKTSSSAFLTYVDSITLVSRGPAWGPIVDAITNTGFKIWDKFRAVSQEDQKRILDALEALKWKPFGSP